MFQSDKVSDANMMSLTIQQVAFLQLFHCLHHGVFLLSITELPSDVSQRFCLGSNGCHSFEGVDCKEAWGEHGHVHIISTSTSVVRMVGQGVRLAHGVAWAMVEHEVELGKVQRPLSLLPVQLLGCTEVLKVLVVHPNLKLAWGTFEVVPPLF